MEDYGQGINPNTGNQLTFKEASEMAAFLTETDEMGNNYIIVVLTIAHLDHTPENCSDDNLASLCQRCHNIYDRPHRNETMHMTRKKGQLEIQFT
jgi:hypothetical protein